MKKPGWASRCAIMISSFLKRQMFLHHLSPYKRIPSITVYTASYRSWDLLYGFLKALQKENLQPIRQNLTTEQFSEKWTALMPSFKLQVQVWWYCQHLWWSVVNWKMKGKTNISTQYSFRYFEIFLLQWSKCGHRSYLWKKRSWRR